MKIKITSLLFPAVIFLMLSFQDLHHVPITPISARATSVDGANDVLVLSVEEQKFLLALARSAIKARLQNIPFKLSEKSFLDAHPELKIPRATFVTLRKKGRLRGCIGELIAQNALYESVIDRAIKAATQDYRFSPVIYNELDDLTISISILTPSVKMDENTPSTRLAALRPGKDGILLVYRGNQSTFLPSVWDEISSPEDFLSQLCRKQYAPTDCWKSKNTVLYRYETYEFSE